MGKIETSPRPGGFIFISGQGSMKPETKEKPKDVEAQTRQALENIQVILETGGGTMNDIVQCQVILRNIGDYAKVNTVYSTFFKEKPPARTCWKAENPGGDDQLVEINAIAYVGDR
jgi:2-iminobutanoate/2-iminopropanoate deaminase